ncbi:MAG: hypothetical protein V3U84_02745 [Thiotrichaceae bacterium]
MNGKTAKRLRRFAQALVESKGLSAGEGYNQYDQETNAVSWEPVYVDGYRHDFSEELDPEGRSIAAIINATHERAKDPDGNELLARFKNPGTLHHKHKVRILYKALKKMWKDTHGKHEIFARNFKPTGGVLPPRHPA